MNGGQKEWYKRYSTGCGAEEFLRIGCVYAIWQMTNLGLSLWLKNSGIIMVFLAVTFIFASLAIRWQQVYTLLQRTTENEKAPIECRPSTQKWWTFVTLVLKLVLPTPLNNNGLRLILR